VRRSWPKSRPDFDERLAKIASDPRQWMTFIEQVAVFGARYSLGNQLLLLMQAEERGMTPQFFLPYGNRRKRTGWYRHNRYVRAGETGFKVWAAIKRRPTEEQAQQWEAAGRKVRRDPDGRPSIQVVGFRLESTFDPLSRESEPAVRDWLCRSEYAASEITVGLGWVACWSVRARSKAWTTRFADCQAGARSTRRRSVTGWRLPALTPSRRVERQQTCRSCSPTRTTLLVPH